MPRGNVGAAPIPPLMKIAIIAGCLTIFSYMLILSDYAQIDKFREGYNRCQLYQSQYQKPCPILEK